MDEENQNIWIWSTFEENWETLRNKNIWATDNKNTAQRIKRNDKIIFYVKGTNQFKGIYRVSSEWYETDEIIWEDEQKEKRKKYRFEVKLKPVLLGNANFWDLVPKLEFVAKKDDKRLAAFYLQGSPGNYKKPINRNDYSIIYDAIKSGSSSNTDELSLSKDAENFIEEFKKNPENQLWLEKKVKAFNKWRAKFSPLNVDRLSAEDFRSFLSFSGNQSWDGIQRQPSVYSDMEKLRNTIIYLVDGINDVSIEEIQSRLDNVLNPDGSYKIKGLDRAVVTGIMHICDTKNRLGVWNSKVKTAFLKLGLEIATKGSRGEHYISRNRILNVLGSKYDLNLYQVDMLMNEIAVKYNPGHNGEVANKNHFILQTGGPYEDKPETTYQFREGIPGSALLRKAENNGKFVYYENGEFYATVEIGRITSYAKDATTFYNAEIIGFAKIVPVEFNDVKSQLTFSSIGQAGIRKISEEDYRAIVGKKDTQDLDFLKSDLKLARVDLSFDQLIFEDEETLKGQIYSALSAGKHIMLVGPPGTGKTEIALKLCQTVKDRSYIDDYIFTTATSDWTTFDTVGGYVPSKTDQCLEFMPGLFLRCFRDDQRLTNKWLVIDEINRCDIDKAFGQLFTVLSGQNVELPFRIESGSVSILQYNNVNTTTVEKKQYIVSKSWRLLATLNTYDKASLYQMSFAFMRRFAFVHVAAPTPSFIDANWDRYIQAWKLVVPVDLKPCVDDLKEIWKEMNMETQRPLEPAIIKDMLELLIHHRKDVQTLPQNFRKSYLTDAVTSYVIPQFEGLERIVLDGLKKILGKYCISEKIDYLFKELFEA